MATIYKVSELAGVSLATVSRVINKSGNVTPKTRQKVLAAIAELGYRPNSMAQSLASKRSNSVGVLIPELYGPFFGIMLSSVESELHKAGKRTIVTAGHSDEATERDCIEFLLGSTCDALILHVQAVSDDYLLEISEGPVPVVLLNRHVPKLADRCISLDNEHGGYVATRTLLERGHEKLAYISGPSWKMDSFKRLAGHRRALEEFGLDFDERLAFEGDFEEASGREGVIHLLKQKLQFTGLVCANDEMAAGAMQGARAHGLSIPGDLSVVGYDDVAFTRYLNPQLSSVNCRIEEMGQMAARAVLKHAYDTKDLVIQNTFKPHVMLRASIGSR
ncbi:MAG: LacI family DNA-binding transcriptional regulator [Xanthomonadales bacterium]|nr:LacI family transcriptional regulator [Gammaproteobacteria bacterium]MBT8073164.1 LacI family transcriptional regulator [Gammaproteobacteria bacterium]NNK04008.1 LacI family DNA-binding transcriptional regulator [Xanthomonadales bacterium]